jgi:Tfp pilus assembly protein FimV
MTVTVKKGDSLWNIADNLTGDGERWHELVDANPNLKLSEDYVIQPGQVLHVPHWARTNPMDSTSDERTANNVVRHDEWAEEGHGAGLHRAVAPAMAMEEAVMWAVKHVTA